MQRLPLVVSVAALISFAALVAGNIATTSPTSDEPTHLMAGWTYLQHRDYRTNPEHPPLVKLLAAAPLQLMDVWPARRRDEGQRTLTEWQRSWNNMFVVPLEQWRLAALWLYGRKDAALDQPTADPILSGGEKTWSRSDFLNDSARLIRAGRIPILLLGLTCGVFVFLWSRALWGAWGAAASTVLFAFDPSMIAHSGVITTDVAMATAAVATLYFFWRASQQFTPGNAAAFAIAFAVAQTVKFTAVLLVPIVLILAAWQLVASRGSKGRNLLILAGAAGFASFIAIWAVYGFRFSAAADGDGAFYTENVLRRWELNEQMRDSRVILPDHELPRAEQRMPIAGAKALLLAARKSRLLPEAYVHGIAFAGASTTIRLSYLRGEFSKFGFGSYFFWTWLYKTPVPAMIAIVAGLVLALRARPRGIAFLIVPAVVFLAASVMSRFNIGHRHILHVTPFLLILCGSLGAWFAKLKRHRGAAATVAIATVAISSSVVFAGRPDVMFGNHLAYLNEIAGGPRRGYVLINDSNFDWGQDLQRLGKWLRKQKVEAPIDLVFFGTADPRYYGIPFYGATPDAPPRSRYLAISTAIYIGLFERPEERDRWQRYIESTNATFVGPAGYSILIFRVPKPKTAL